MLKTLIAMVVLIVSVPSITHALNGTSCKTLNQKRTLTVNGKQQTYICTASGKKKVWRAKSSNSNNDKTDTKSVVVWRDSGAGTYFASNGTAPKCDAISWTFPIPDISALTGMLYPGQLRGGRYKAHGGFKASSHDVQVISPITGYITSGATYREMGEIQHMIEIQHPCGIAVRFDHLFTLSSSVKQLFDKSVAVRDDSRGTFFDPPIPINAGDVVATTTGFVAANNTNFDFGAYDFRTIQKSNRPPADLAQFGPDGTLGKYGLCVLSIFGSTIEARLRALPTVSSVSDFC